MKTDPRGESMVKCCDSRISTTSSPVSCNPLLWWWRESKGCTCRIGDPQWILQWDKVNFWQVSTGLHFAPLHILYHCNMECCFHLFFSWSEMILKVPLGECCSPWLQHFKSLYFRAALGSFSSVWAASLHKEGIC